MNTSENCDLPPKRRRRWRRAAGALLFVLVAFNALAARHAWRMTSFLPDSTGAKPEAPEDMSLARKLDVLVTGLDVPRPRNNVDPTSVGLDFETRTLVAEDDTRLSSWFVPRADARGTVVLLHGYSATAQTVLREARWFHDAGFATLLLDFRGSGESDGNVTTLGWNESLDVAAAVREARQLVSGPVIAYGQSMGAVAALRAVAHGAAAIDALILESPFHTLVATVEKRFELMGLPSFPAAQVLTFWGGALQGFDAFALRPVDDARSVTAPTLLLSGSRDARVHEREARQLFDQLAGDKQLHFFATAGHTPLRPYAPDEWDRLVRSFLDERFAAGHAPGGEPSSR